MISYGNAWVQNCSWRNDVLRSRWLYWGRLPGQTCRCALLWWRYPWSTPEQLTTSTPDPLSLQPSLISQKTVICPKTTSILGWIRSQGRLSANSHRIAALVSCPPIPTVLSRVLLNCSNIIDPLECALTGLQCTERFKSLQDFLSNHKGIVIPRLSDTLWIVTDGSVTRRGLSATLYVSRTNWLHLAGFSSGKLRKHLTFMRSRTTVICCARKSFRPIYYSVSASNDQQGDRYGRQSGRRGSSAKGDMVLRCDRLLAGANAALITSKHDDFKKEPEKESTKEPVQEPCNEADQEPANRLQKLSSYHIQHGWEIRCTCGCAWWSSGASFAKSPQNKLWKNPGRVATGKKLAERTGVAREAKKKKTTKTENIRSSLWAKRERQRRSQRIFASWNRRPGYLRSGRLLSATGETWPPAKLGHLSLSKSHVAIFAPWIEILLHNIYNHAQKHDWKSCSRDPNDLWPMELL